ALAGPNSETVMVGGSSKHVVGYMRDFLFTPEQARTPLRALSGGERGRVMLARALAKSSNALVLDEPTNDLDLETLDVLEEMLGTYAGTVILISHDRDFLDRVVNAVIVPEGDGRWSEYAGGYADMLAQRGADLARASTKASPASSEKPSRALPTPASADPGLASKRKLSFHEKHALDTLPAHMAALEADIVKLQARLDDPTLYARNREEFTRMSGLLAKTQADLAAAEEKWLALEILREEIEGL